MSMDAEFRLPGVRVAPRAPRPLRQPLVLDAELDRRGIALRPETPDDLPFLSRLYAASRAAEMAMTPHWDAATRRDFVEKQFAYQYLHHSRFYAEADFALITKSDQPIGRLYLLWGADNGRDCRLFAFELIAGQRNQGIGAGLLAAVLRQARAVRRSVSLHVEPISAARRLYARFGFAPIGQEAETGALLMRWRDGPVTQASRVTA